MSSSSNTITNVINPKPCNYNCGTRIYWNTASSEYWEVFTKKKHKEIINRDLKGMEAYYRDKYKPDIFTKKGMEEYIYTQSNQSII